MSNRSLLQRLELLSLIFLNLQTFGEGADFCFDGSNKGQRLNSTVTNYTQANSGAECIQKCMLQDESCRSVNFLKDDGTNRANDCEFLRDVSTEKPHLLLANNSYHYFILLNPNRTAQNPAEFSSSCQKLLEKDQSFSNGVYKLRNNDSLEEYQVYCHITKMSGCGTGGWTLVMKIDGSKTEFNYSSPYWTNKETYAVEDGLEGLTEKQTKMASYWNTPFDKICLGMKVNNVIKWIVINYQASSLFNVIADGDFKDTSVGRDKWLSLMDGSRLQPRCNKEGFNLESTGVAGYNDGGYIRVRIGIIANNVAHCNGCDTCIGFGTSAYGCNKENIRARNTTCGNIAICNKLDNKNTPAFGYIFVQ